LALPAQPAAISRRTFPRLRLPHAGPSLEETLAGIRDLGLRLLDRTGLRDRLVGVGVDGVSIVSCPTYKGCHSFGKNIDEALANLKEVAEMCIAEQEQPVSNQFIGVREMELTINATA